MKLADLATGSDWIVWIVFVIFAALSITLLSGTVSGIRLFSGNSCQNGEFRTAIERTGRDVFYC